MAARGARLLLFGRGNLAYRLVSKMLARIPEVPEPFILTSLDRHRRQGHSIGQTQAIKGDSLDPFAISGPIPQLDLP